MTIKLLGRDSSSNVQKVRWALLELGLSYEHIPVGGKFGGNKTPDYLALNPNGLVPVLRDGDLVVWESHAIVRYLAAVYGAGTMFPTDPRERATVDQWADWTATTFQPAWLGVFWKLVRTPEDQRNPVAIATAVAETERCLSIMDGQLGRTGYLGGEALTYADIVAGVAMFRWTSMPIERREHPNVTAWHERLRARAAFREAVEVDYSEMVGRLAF